MKIYISGKISGLPNMEAWLNFDHVECVMDSIGIKCVNPMSKKYIKNRMSLPWTIHMIFDIFLLIGCNGIYMQDNWKDSRGARIEYKIALCNVYKLCHPNTYNYQIST